MLKSPMFSVSLLSWWVVSQWVPGVSGLWVSGHNLPPPELPFTWSGLLSAQLLSWVSLCPWILPLSVICSSPPALLTSLVWDDTWATLPSLKLLSWWFNLQFLFQACIEACSGGASVVLGIDGCHLSHKLGWSCFNQWDVYQQLLLYTVCCSGNFCLDVLSKMC